MVMRVMRVMLMLTHADVAEVRETRNGSEQLGRSEALGQQQPRNGERAVEIGSKSRLQPLPLLRLGAISLSEGELHLQAQNSRAAGERASEPRSGVWAGVLTGLCKRPATYKLLQFSKSSQNRSVDMTPYLICNRGECAGSCMRLFSTI